MFNTAATLTNMAEIIYLSYSINNYNIMQNDMTEMSYHIFVQ